MRPRFTYTYDPERTEYVVRDRAGVEVAAFDSLHQCEVYVLERSTRSER